MQQLVFYIILFYYSLFVTQFGKTEHNACLLILNYKPMFAKNIFFGEEAFFTPSYNMITHGSFDTKIAR